MRIEPPIVSLSAAPAQVTRLDSEIWRAVLPRDTIATCDAGASRLLVVQKWQSYAPREFLASECGVR